MTRCAKCESFGQWCIDHNRLDLINRWDTTKNQKSPFDIGKRSGTKYWFRCPIGEHESEQKTISNIPTQEKSSACSICNSFGGWAKDNFGHEFFKNYWSDSNTLSPYDFTKRSLSKAYFKCNKDGNHPDYLCSIHNFAAGKRCPCCARKNILPSESLAAEFPEIIDIWFDQEVSPFEIAPKSNKPIKLFCNTHGIYSRMPCSIEHNDFCPQCNRERTSSRLQSLVSNYLTELGFTVLHESNCTLSPINPQSGRRLLYDNEIPELKLIIEVHGVQHYKVTNFAIAKAHKDDITAEQVLEYSIWRDKFKRNYALQKGYSYLEIPYTTEKDESYKALIDKEICNICEKEKSA